MISDAEIVKACLEGDREKQGLLYEKYAPLMLGVCMRYFRDRDEAQDALQEGFIRVFTKLRSFKEKGSLEGWIRRVIINTALNYYRGNIKHYYHDDINEMEEFIEDDKAVGDQFEREDLLNIIKSLPDGYRIVFNLYEVDGYSHKEIAEMLNISANTSKSQLLKARKQLQKKLAKLKENER